MSQRTFDVNCPYCRHSNRRLIPASLDNSLATSGVASFREIVYCDNEDGGCDTPFAIFVTVTLDVEVQIHALTGVGKEVQAEEEDRRFWIVKTRNADDPEADSTDYLDAARMRERARGNSLFTLALEMGAGDSLESTSVQALTYIKITCDQPEAPRSFFNFKAARHAARDAALLSGAAQEIYFEVNAGAFRVYPTNPLPLPPPPAGAELIQTVEPPIVFKIISVQLGAGARLGPENYFVAEVHCNDSRINEGFQEHGNSELYATSAFEKEADAHAQAADWIRREAGGNPFFIDSPFADDGDIPF